VIAAVGRSREIDEAIGFHQRAAMRLSSTACAVVWNAPPSAIRLARVDRMSWPRRLKATNTRPSRGRTGARKRAAPT